MGFFYASLKIFPIAKVKLNCIFGLKFTSFYWDTSLRVDPGGIPSTSLRINSPFCGLAENRTRNLPMRRVWYTIYLPAHFFGPKVVFYRELASDKVLHHVQVLTARLRAPVGTSA